MRLDAMDLAKQIRSVLKRARSHQHGGEGVYNMTRFGLFLALTTLAACGAPSPSPGPSDGRRSCASLGWSCGVDDFGTACGSCTGGRTCSGGTCATPGCTPVCGLRNCGSDTTCGASCGTCSTGQACSSVGVCVTTATTCSLTGFSVCVVGGSLCCAPFPDGTLALCSTPVAGGSSYYAYPV